MNKNELKDIEYIKYLLQSLIIKEFGVDGYSKLVSEFEDHYSRKIEYGKFYEKII